MEGFLDHDAPTCELPRSNSRYTGSRQHPIALVGNHSHRLRQLHLLDVGFLWWSQPQPRYQQRFRLLQYDHNLQPIILALVLLSTALAIAGSFTPRVRILAGSLVTSVAALVGYAELIGYTASNNCQGAGCITQPTGSETIFGVTRTWGFQQGFYMFTAATILVLVGMVFHQTLTQHRSKGATSNQTA